MPRQEHNPAKYDPILRIVQIAEELWGNKKDLNYTIGKRSKKAALGRMKKNIEELQKEIDKTDKEFELLARLNGLDKE